MKCQKCGNTVTVGDKFCENCGALLENMPDTSQTPGGNARDASSVVSNSSESSPNKINPERVNFLITTMQENLQQARHVEMERVSFVALHTILIIIAMGVVGNVSRGNIFVHLLYSIGMICMCLVTLALTIRWSDVLDYHRDRVSECYAILHNDIMKNKSVKTYFFTLNIEDMMARGANMRTGNFRARKLFFAYNIVLLVMVCILSLYLLVLLFVGL